MVYIHLIHTTPKSQAGGGGKREEEKGEGEDDGEGSLFFSSEASAVIQRVIMLKKKRHLRSLSSSTQGKGLPCLSRTTTSSPGEEEKKAKEGIEARPQKKNPRENLHDGATVTGRKEDEKEEEEDRQQHLATPSDTMKINSETKEDMQASHERKNDRIPSDRKEKEPGLNSPQEKKKKTRGPSIEEQHEDPSQPVHTLFNLQLIKKDSALYDVVESLKRIEELSHILVWSLAGRKPRDADDVHVLSQPLSMDLIELPR